MKNRRLVRVGAGLALAALGLSGCADTARAGSAVVWDSGRVTEDELAAQVNVIAAISGAPVTPEATNEVVSFAAQEVLVVQAAQRLDISVTPGDIERRAAEAIEANGGAEAISEALAASDATLDDFTELMTTLARRDLLLEAISAKLAPESDDAQAPPVVLEYLTLTSVAIDLATNPRFGVWNPSNLAAQLNPNVLSRPGDNATGALPEGLVLPGGN